MVREVLTNDEGQATGVSYVSKDDMQEYQVKGKMVILGASAGSESVFYRDNARLSTIASPLSAYNTVFSGATAMTPGQSPTDLLKRRKSILDVVKQDGLR